MSEAKSVYRIALLGVAVVVLLVALLTFRMTKTTWLDLNSGVQQRRLSIYGVEREFTPSDKFSALYEKTGAKKEGSDWIEQSRVEQTIRSKFRYNLRGGKYGSIVSEAYSTMHLLENEGGSIEPLHDVLEALQKRDPDRAKIILRKIISELDE